MMDRRGDEEFREAVVRFLLCQEGHTATAGDLGKAVPKTLSKDGVVGVTLTALLRKWPETFSLKTFGRMGKRVLRKKEVLVTLKAIQPAEAGSSPSDDSAAYGHQGKRKFGMGDEETFGAPGAPEPSSAISEARGNKKRRRITYDHNHGSSNFAFTVPKTLHTPGSHDLRGHYSHSKGTCPRYQGNRTPHSAVRQPFAAHENRPSWKTPQQRQEQHTLRPLLPEPRDRGAWQIFPRTAVQRAYADALTSQEPSPSILVATGPAGTGKTVFACQAGIQQLYSGAVQKIIITRPSVASGEDIGFLPGDADAKMAPYLQPIIDCLTEVWGSRSLEDLRALGAVEVVPLGFMRGRTFKKTWIIADEMQNSTPAQMKNILTRLGEGSKIVITGDQEQSDLRRGFDTGLRDLVGRLRSKNDESFGQFRLFELGTSDVQRSQAVVEVMNLYREAWGRL